MNARLRSAFALVVAGLVVLVSGAAVQSAPGTVVPGSAEPMGSVPATISGVANGHLDKDAPVPACGATAGVNWYTVRAPHRGAMVARLVARGDLDAQVAVYRIVRSQRLPVLCAATNRHGRARVAWYAYTDGSYLVGVGRREGSAVGPFDLTVLASDRPESTPGTSLPAEGATGTVNPVLDASDAWSVQMNRGTTYRINLTTPWKVGCIGYSVYRPNISSFAHATAVTTVPCGGYDEFTPGLDGGGLYSVLVNTRGDDPVSHAYRLQVGTAGPDDTAPGVRIDNGQFVSGSIFGRGLDAVDMYRFAVPRDNELTTLELRQKANVGFDLLVMNETGNRTAAIRQGRGSQALRLHIPAGRYYAVVRSRAGNGGAYGLQFRVRDVTATAISASGATYVESPVSTPLPITVQVTQASHGGRVIVEIDHFDPIAGWHYAASMNGSVTSSGTLTTSWMPPSIGHFRARARFVANPYSSFSESGYVRMHVVEPLE